MAFVKRARNDADDPESWTAAQRTMVGVSTRPRFLKQVVELIGPDMVSAGETFTMALMGREPHITCIGDNTKASIRTYWDGACRMGGCSACPKRKRWK